MRKGQLKSIEKLQKNGIYDARFENILKKTTIPVKNINLICSYVISCKRANLEYGLIVDEILKYEKLEYDKMFFALYPWDNKGDVLIGKEDIKSFILQKVSEGKAVASGYNQLFREIIVPRIKDKTLSNLIVNLAENYNKRKIGKTGEFTHCSFYWQLRKFYPYEEKCEKGSLDDEYNSDICAAIKKLLWDDFVEKKEKSTLYKIWGKGWAFDFKAFNFKEGIHFTRTFGEAFIEYLKDQDGDLKDNLLKYFIFNKEEKRAIHFDYIKAESELNSNNILFAVYDRIKEIKPEINDETYVVDYDNSLVEKIENICGETDFSIKKPFFAVRFKKSASGTLNLRVVRYPYTEKNKTIYGAGKYLDIELFCTPKNQIFIKNMRNKYGTWRPLCLKSLVPFMECELLMMFFEILAEETRNMLLKDVIRDMVEADGSFVSPIKYEDTLKYHNKAEYFLSSYKKAGEIKWNYNKHNINLSYAIVKALNKVSKADYGILQNTSEEMIRYIKNPPLHCRQKGKEMLKKFLVGYYIEKDPGCRDIAEDFVKMCFDAKRPIALRYSVARMIDEHDHFVNNQEYSKYNKQVKAFKVPKNSRYKKLREALPEEFEWIKSKKRLIKESMEMHHCVWSYYSKIAEDNCAIYSFLDKDASFDVNQKGEVKRYTIEFVYDPQTNTYCVRQIQTKYDRGGGTKLEKYLERFLKENLT